MSKLFEKYDELWWRFSKMEVRDDYLQPAKGAKLEWYDPWELHRQHLGGESADSPLNRLLAICSDSSQPLIPHADKLIEWSQDFGPLGVLLMRTVRVVLPPRREKISSNPWLLERAAPLHYADETERARIGDEHTWVVETYRFEGGWFGMREAPEYGENPRPWLADRRPSATLRSIWAAYNKPDEQGTLGQDWARFFPSVAKSERETYAYPGPSEREAFAKLYREPLDEWATYARQITRAVQAINPNATRDDRMSGAHMLSVIAAPLRQTLDVSNASHPQLISRSPALVSSLALMAMQQLGGGAQVRACKDPQCGVLFLPINDRAEYHENKCRWRHHKALQRAAAKPKPKRKRAPKRRSTSK